MNDKESPVGVTRPKIDFAEMERVYIETCKSEMTPQGIMVDGEYYAAGEQMPEHVLETLRLWVNFE